MAPRRWRLAPVILCLAIFSAAAQGADSTSESFAAANALYERGEYARAAAEYEAIARGGEMGADLFYNLGNAWYRLGEPGRALLNYERALTLRPGHAEAAANRAFVRADPASSPVSVWRKWGADTWAVSAACGAWLAVAGLCAAAARRRRAAGLIAGAIGCALLVPAVAGLKAWREGPWHPDAAIVTAAKGEILRYAPASTAAEAGPLRPGESVRLIRTVGDWCYLRLPDGRLGWTRASAVERLRPGAGT